jgi:hypothetical protein
MLPNTPQISTPPWLNYQAPLI